MQEKSIHPPESAKFAEPKRPAETWNRVKLDEYTPYSVFAWEFLRRNRYYQALVDRRKNAPPLDVWGYQWHESVPFTHGLIKLKPYWEAYQEGEPPMWQGLDDFLIQLPQSIDLAEREFTTKLRPGQIAVVLDIGGSFFGKSPWEVQLNALIEKLSELSPAFKHKVMHQSILFRRWCLLKLMNDEHKSLQSASMDHTYTNKYSPRKAPKTGANQLTKPRVPRTTVSEDASAIFELVYEHGYLYLLSGERGHEVQGDKLVPYSLVLASEADESET